MALFQRAHRNDNLVTVTSLDDKSLDDDSFIKLVFALGNIGKQYQANRHNVGFMIVDKFAESNSFPGWKSKTKLKCSLSEDFYCGKKYILAKPTTMYNLVGDSLRLLIDFYKLDPSDVLIIHDDIDLNFGDIRLKKGGGSGGNNGLKSILSQVDSNTNRLRFGTKNADLDKIDPADFVLQDFNKSEQPKLNQLIDQASNHI